MTRQEIGEKLRESRKKVGYSQEKVASATGLRKSQISQMENGSVNFTVDKLIVYCNFLEIDFL